MDLLEGDMPQDNAPEFSVSELSGAIKRVIEGEFAHVRLRGEVGRVMVPRSGHLYVDLKDDRSVIAGVIWKGVAARLQTLPEEGMEVVATGRITTFAGQSKYQLVIEDIRPAGVGALMAMLEKRKAALASEGLFDPARKRALPYLPEVIGVVTSPSGAVIRDILHRLRDRFPRKVLVWPVAVQGAKCAPEVTRAIAGFNALTPGGALPRPDLLIVARGGGSIEDLWGFNEENVARAAAASEIPLISAVGHETDTTLIDFVSDKRAPTPTAAAELAVPVRLELLTWVEGQGARLARVVTSQLTQHARRLSDIARVLPRPEALVESPRQRLDFLGERLSPGLIQAVQKRRVRLSDLSGVLRPALVRRNLRAEQARGATLGQRLAPALARVTQTARDRFEARAARLRPAALSADVATKRTALAQISARLAALQTQQVSEWRRKLDATDRLRETLSYKATLARGYAVVRQEGAVVTHAAQAKTTLETEVEFADGRVSFGGAGPVAPKRKPAPKPRDSKDQGSLF